MRDQPVLSRRHLREIHRHRPAGRPRKSWLAIAAGGLAVAMMAGAGLAYYAMSLQTAAAETVTLKEGTVELSLDMDAFIVRKERVYAAPAAGRIRRIVEDGQRVRVGSPVVQILPAQAAQQPAVPPTTPPPSQQQNGEAATRLRREIDQIGEQIYKAAVAWNDARSQGDHAAMTRLQAEMDQLAVSQRALAEQLGRIDHAPPSSAVVAPPPILPSGAPAEVIADQSGVVVYHVDGLEGALVPGGTAEWTPAWVRALTPTLRKTADTTAAGAPIFKVIDNLSLSLLAVLPEGSLGDLGPDGRVLLRFPDRADVPVAARVMQRQPVGGEMVITLTAPVFPEDFTDLRTVKATLVFGRFEGKVVPRTAIDVRDGLQGVWAVRGGRPVFHPARVLGGNGRELALETELLPGEQILRQAPTWIR